MERLGCFFFRGNKKGGWLGHLIVIVVFHGEVKSNTRDTSLNPFKSNIDLLIPKGAD